MSALFDLTGEVAVVFGGTGALGGALAEALAQAGAAVAVVGRSAERGEAAAGRLRQSGSRAVFIQADATDRKSVEACRHAVEAKLGAATVLVNAAGGNSPSVTVTPENPFQALSLAAWEESFRLNLAGGILIPCQVFGPAMAERGGGSIINIASVSAHIPLSRVPAYSAAKAAVLNLTRFLAREWASRGVRVNSITPGFFPAEQNRALLYQPDGSPTPRARAILSHTPMGRFGEAWELGGAAVFLASRRASSFVTGADVVVDGGFLSTTL